MEELLDAPLFKPTKEEFEDPISFIKSIRCEAEKAGIARIIPPAEWEPPFSLDVKKVKFHTRLQDLNKLSAESRLSEEFAETVRKFNFLNCCPMATDSSLNQKIKWRKLFKVVMAHGGYQKVCEKKSWPKIAKGSVTINDAKTDGQELEDFYSSSLLSYEHHISQLQHETADQGETPDDGDKAADSEGSSKQQEVKDMEIENDSGSQRRESKRQRRASSISDKSENSGSEQASSGKETEKQKFPLVQIGRKFWRYFPDLDKCLFGQIKSVDKTKAATRYLVEYKEEEAKKEGLTLEAVAKTQLEILVANGTDAASAKAAFEGEICEDCSRAIPAGRTATCAACACHYHHSCARDMHQKTRTPRGPKKDGSFVISKGRDWYCADCVKDVAEELFDFKSKAKTQASKPTSNRFAKERLERMSSGRNRYQYGFNDGDWHTVDSFRRYEKKFFNTHLKDLIGEFPEKGTKTVQRSYERKLEAQFWNFLGNADGVKREKLEVQYGSDLDTGSMGSGFPRNAPSVLKRPNSKGSKRAALPQPDAVVLDNKEASIAKGGNKDLKEDATDPAVMAKYLSSGWNLNNLPTISGSVLRHLHGAVKGVMIPWLYMGMMFSTFCWHTEDHNLYSINYHHWGRPKVWYGVRGSDAPKFDAVVRDMFPELFEKNPDLLLQLVTMVNPLELSSRGLRVVRTIQRPGEYVVTFPQSYHAGFNMGLNCAEAVNFATPDWLPWGVHALKRYASFHRTPVFSHDALVLAIGRSLVLSPPGERADCLPFALQQLEKILERNRATRETAFRAGVIDDVKTMAEFPGRRKLKRRCRGSLAPNYTEDTLASDEYAEFLSSSNGGGGLRCNECNQYCFLEVIACNKCGPRRVNCADHLEQTCLCQDATTLTLYQRFEDDILEDLISRIRIRLDLWEAWKQTAHLLKQKLENSWTELGKRDLDTLPYEVIAQASNSCLVKLSEIQAFYREGEALGVGLDDLLPFKKVLNIIEEWIIRCQVLLPGLDRPSSKEAGMRKVTFGQALALLKEGLVLPLRPEQELSTGVQTLSQACEMWSSICDHFQYTLPNDLQECIKFCISLDSNNEDKLMTKGRTMKGVKNESLNADHLGSLVSRILDCQVIMPEIKEIQKKYC